ncbi:MAG: serine/threonine protein kinase [uncultured bacterium]|nr:MAG: serine/threonine protein kinase [uncultured bacterium]
MQLGRYQLLTRIASGGMADVYKATLTGIEGFEKTFAIKKILPHWSENREFVDMLIDEARILLHLNHSNIVQIFELGLEEKIYFLVMEYVEGVDLKKLLTKMKAEGKKLPLSVVVYLMREIAKGLQYAHEKRDRQQRKLGIVHRDISPQNVLLSFEGDVKLTDFGIAKIIGKTHETVTGTLKGKFAYMSPEQALGEEVDWRTDLFALGILFYEAMTGERCFKGSTDLETLEAVRKADISLPKNLEEQIPPELSTLVFKLLKKDKKERYQLAAELVDDLLRLELLLGYSGAQDELIRLLRVHFTEVNDVDQESTIMEGGEEFLKTKILTHTEKEGLKKTKILVNREQVLEEPIVRKKFSLIPAKRVKMATPRLKKNIYFGMSTLVVIILLGFFLKNILVDPLPVKKAEPYLQKLDQLPVEKKAVPSLVVPQPEEIKKTDEPAPVNVSPTPSTPYKASYSIKGFPAGTKIRVRYDTNKSMITNDLQSQTFDLKNDKDFWVSVEKDGYIPETFRFSLSSSQPNVYKEITLQKTGSGDMAVLAKPWGRVSIPGLVSGADTPFYRSHVTAGTYIVKVYFPPTKKTVAKTVKIDENSAIKCQAEFTEKSSILDCK